MSLADRVMQCREPFKIRDPSSGRIRTLSGAADYARAIGRCGVRFVLDDELTQRCAALAYSKGARALECTDLLRIPAPVVWVEWSYFVWQEELARYGLRAENASCARGGRRGALISSSPDRRRGTMRTFWTNDHDTDVLASSVEAWFDLDEARDEGSRSCTGVAVSDLRVEEFARAGAGLLKRCFRFGYQRSWQTYYEHAPITYAARDALARHALGMIAADIPLLLVFFRRNTCRSVRR
jgi:hypothetical protein